MDEGWFMKTLFLRGAQAGGVVLAGSLFLGWWFHSEDKPGDQVNYRELDADGEVFVSPAHDWSYRDPSRVRAALYLALISLSDRPVVW